jgi:hypothetical protein
VTPTLPSLTLAVVPLERVLSGGDGPVPAPIASELRAIAARLRDLAQRGTRSPGSLCREGEYWTITHDEAVLRLRHTKGLVYLAQLLGQPDTELHAIALEASGPFERAGAIPRLDPEAKLAYRARIDELRGEATDAVRRGDLEVGERCETEIGLLLRELAAGIGLGGRDRGFASAVERARVNVTRNLHAAIDRISEANPVLGRHLATSVRTGAFCCYAPDPTAAIRWLVIP